MWGINNSMHYCSIKKFIIEIIVEKLDNKLVLKNYDYNFLNKAIAYCKKHELNTVIAGYLIRFME